MGLLNKVFGRRKPAAPPVTEIPPCPHTTLVPKWDSTAAMGHADQVSGYTCDSCHRAFTAAEGRALRQTEAERLKRDLGV